MRKSLTVDEVCKMQCPVCGYYCLGKGGYGCIDKPKMLELAEAATLDSKREMHP